MTDPQPRASNVRPCHLGTDPGAPVSGEYRVGDRPPDTVDVRAATVTVPSGMEDVSEPAREAAKTGGYDGVATAWPGGVDGPFPPTRRGRPPRRTPQTC